MNVIYIYIYIYICISIMTKIEASLASRSARSSAGPPGRTPTPGPHHPGSQCGHPALRRLLMLIMHQGLTESESEASESRVQTRVRDRDTAYCSEIAATSY